jgi:hypothetical protein
VITEVAPDTANPELIHGRYLFRLEARTLDHIRALGNNDAADELRFATAARVSEVNLGLYRTLVAPAVRAMVTEQSAETLRQLHPNRLRFSMFSDANPFMAPVKALAETVRAARQPVSPDNPLLTMEKMASSWISTWLQAWGNARDMMTEHMFLATYGSPLLQAMVGMATDQPLARRGVERDLLREATEARLRAELANRFESGGLQEAMIRALIYVRLPERSADERGFAVMQAFHQAQPAEQRLSYAQLKEIFTEQFLLLHQDEERAVHALTALLPHEAAQRRAAIAMLRRVVSASGTLSEEGSRRLARVEALFNVADQAKTKGQVADA